MIFEHPCQMYKTFLACKIQLHMKEVSSRFQLLHYTRSTPPPPEKRESTDVKPFVSNISVLGMFKRPNNDGKGPRPSVN